MKIKEVITSKNYSIKAFLAVLIILFFCSCNNQKNNSSLYDHPGVIVSEPPYFQKAVKSKDYRNPYDINKQYPLDGDSYYVPPTTNTNENNNGIPKSGWDRMY